MVNIGSGKATKNIMLGYFFKQKANVYFMSVIECEISSHISKSAVDPLLSTLPYGRSP